MRGSLPLAYFVTLRTYGTWLHGDDRGSHHRRRRAYRGPVVARSERWHAAEEGRLRHPPVLLDAAARAWTEQVVHEVCDHRGWGLLAVNARTNHVHLVVAARCAPEAVATTVKARVTRRLLEHGSVSSSTSLWARHASTVYLWTATSVDSAIDYTVNRQGAPPR